MPISYNPRLVKEADALFEAGYAVSVVSPLTDDQRAALDNGIARSRGWRWRSVDVRSRPLQPLLRWLATGLTQRVLRALPAGASRETFLDRAYSRYVGALAAAASSERAALYIAHNLPALPAAARAARKMGVQYAFDAEDYHRGQFTEGQRARDPRSYDLTVAVERRYIPNAMYISAASDGIGEMYARDLGINAPVTVLNSFPLADRDAEVSSDVIERERRAPGPSLYWYSQIIGPDRGIDDALRALPGLPQAQLHLRGEWASGYEQRFFREATQLGVRDRIHVLDPAPPGHLVRLAAQHDVGLALEPAASPNREVCVTNKLLTYLLAGNAVAATDTVGQRGILDQAPQAGFLYPPGDVECLAAGLRQYCGSPERLARARRAAREAGERSFFWENEKSKLLALVPRTLAGPVPTG